MSYTLEQYKSRREMLLQKKYYEDFLDRKGGRVKKELITNK